MSIHCSTRAAARRKKTVAEPAPPHQGVKSPGQAAESMGPSVVEALHSPGQPLESRARGFFERRFGHDFSQVRIHADSIATTAARTLGARAFTSNEHIVLGAEAARGDSRTRRTALGHELAHVVQGRRGPRVEEPGESARAESEAKTAAAAVAEGGIPALNPACRSSAIMLSALSDEIAASMARTGKGGVFNILRGRGPISARDADLEAWLTANFGANTDPARTSDDRWLADQLVRYGAEPRWPNSSIVERQQRAGAHGWPQEPGNIEATFGVGAGRQPIRAYFFPGTISQRAMIVGGVHGTEQAGVEVVNILLERMRAPGAHAPYYSVIIVPELFPENVAANRRKTPGRRDPNRQMPAVGASPGTLDTEGDPIEPENLVLLDLVERFRPERLASVHGHSPPRTGGADMPGITSDARPGHEAEDRALALSMARTAAAMPGGARVPGNRLGTPGETAVYPTSTAPHEAGVTLGDYGSHATSTRPPMNMILIETYGYGNSSSQRDPAARATRRIELESLATVLRDIFLGPPAARTP
jgi:hypothetical protein